MTSRKLALNAERLSDLTTEELTVAIGAAAEITNTGYLCVTKWPTCDLATCQSVPPC